MKKNFWKKVLSCLTSISLLINSLLPYSIASVVYAQELTETVISTPTDSPSPTPTDISSPTPSTYPSLTATPTTTPEPTLEPTPEATSSATPEATPSATPTAEPTPSATPTVEPTSSTESAGLSETKVSLRMAGDFIKSSNKQIQKNYVEGEVIVKFKTSKLNVKSFVGKAQAFVFEKRFSLEKTDEIKSANIQVFESNKSTEELVKELKSDPSVEYAEPNYLRFPSTISTDDTYRDRLWGLDNTGQTVNGVVGTNDADIDAPEAWNISDGSGNIIVAIIDSGVAYNHPDLAVNMWDGLSCKDESGATLGGCNHGYDFENNDKIPLPDSSSHGTHIAGIIATAKNNNKGVIGVSPQAKIMALKYDSTVVTEIKAIDFAIQNGAKIINASFGGTPFSQPEYDAINRFKSAGGIFVTSAGNCGDSNYLNNGCTSQNQALYPASYDLSNIVSVAATNQNDGLATFSNYSTTSVDVGAPGTNIYSTVPNETTVLNETFEPLAPPAIPSGWVQTGSWQTFDRTSTWGSEWGKVLYGDYGYPYTNNANTSITSTSYNLTSGGANINFWASCDTANEDSDYMALEVSGGGSYQELGRWNEYDATLPYDYLYIGSSYADIHFTKSIPDQYLTNSFTFRFRWVTNSSDSNYDGCAVDDIRITKYSDGSDEQYGYMNGTSMAAPHVAGLAALIQGYNPNLTSTQVKDIILNTGDTLPVAADAAKILSGKRINAKKALDAAAPALSTIATVTSETYTVGANTITNVPFGTSKATFETALTKGESHQTWTDTGVHDPVVTGDVLVVTAQDGSTQVTYVITVNPDYATIFGGIKTTLLSQGITTNIDTCASTPTVCTGLYFEKTNYGRVTFNASLNLTDSNTNTFLQTLGTKMDANAGSMSFDARTAEQLRTAGAIIKMYGFSHGGDTDPIEVSELIIKDDSGVVINPSDENYPSITGFAWDDVNGVVTFGTSHFTQFYLNDTVKPFIMSFSVPSTATSLEVGGITVTAHDNRGVAGLMFSESSTPPNKNDDMWSTGTPSTYTFASAGTKTLYAWAKDAAGNVSNAYDSKTVTITLPPPPNTPPSFDSIAPQSINEDSSAQNIAITNISPGPDSEASQTVTFSATSSDPPIIPNPTFSGSGSIRTLTYTPAANANGTVTITVTANDGQTSNNIYSQSFNITVNAVNDTPSFTKGSDQTISEDSATQTVSSWATNINIGAVNESGQTPNFIVTNNNNSLFSVQPAVAANGTLSYTPATNANGSATVTVSIHDDGGTANSGNDTSATQTFIITINAVNDAPIITVTSPNGGEIWAGGSSHAITWSASDVDTGNTLTINLEYATDGTNYTGIASGLTNSGTYSWTVPSINSSTVKIRSTVSDGTATVNDLSNANFTIDSLSPDITYNYPSAGGQTTWYNSDPGDVIDVDFIWGGGAPLDNAQRKIGTGSFTNIFTADQSSNYTTNWGFPTWSSLSEGLNEINLKVADTVGNERVENYVADVSGFLFRKDTGAPTTTDSGIDANWHNNDVTVTLNCSDPVSGCATTYHTIDGTIPTASSSTTNPFTLTTDGNYTIKYFSKDTAGNSETVKTAEATVKIDKTKPLIASHDNIAATATSEDGVVVTYTSPSATDNVDATADAACTPTSGSTFPIGETTVNCTKTDAAGNVANPTSFTVTVSANQSPSFDAIINQNVDEDSSSQGISITGVSAGSGEDGQTVIMSATSSDTNIIPNPTFTGSGATRTLAYAPVANAYGTVTITVLANDGWVYNNTSERTFTITVNSVNDKPIANPDTADVNEDQILIITKSSLLSNDTDVEGTTLIFTSVSNPVNGSVVIDGENVVFTPVTNYFGSASFDYTISDGDLTSTTTVSITIDSVNDDPVANSQSFSTNEDTSVEITLSASDVDGDSLIYSIEGMPSNGTLSEVSDNLVTYTPNTNYAGADSFTFKADDTGFLGFTSLSLFKNPLSKQNSSFFKAFEFHPIALASVSTNIATISLTINPVNDEPIANPDIATVNEDTNLIIAKSTLLSNDTDVDGDTLNIIEVSNPINGSVIINGNNIKFTPTANYSGSASFDYTISDGALTSTSTVNITVNSVNDAPVANAQTVTIEEDTTVTINLVGTDVDGDPLTYSIVTDVSEGTLTLISGNQFSYTPDQDYTGSDSFEFRVNDGHVDSSSALVTITVTPFNDPPVLNSIGNQSVNELEELTFTATANDPEGSTLTYSLSDNPTGSSIHSTTGVFSWIPTEAQGPGDYTFSVIVSDGTKTNLEEITVTVNEVNVAPVANNVSVTTNEDTAKTITLGATDSDLPLQTLTYSIVSGVSNGVLGSIVNNQLTYTASTDYNGPDSFTYKANDGSVDSNTAMVNITVTAINDPPVLDFIGNKSVNELATLSFTATAMDPDNTVSYSLTNAPTGATINVTTGVSSFTPTEAQGPGTYTLTVNVTDGTSTDSEEITITVNEVNVAPVASDISVVTDEDIVKNITLNASDADLPAQGINYFLVANPSHGTLDTIIGGALNYTPHLNYNGPDSFTYKANDSLVDSNIATVTITVNSINDAPVSANGSVSTGENVAKTITFSATDSDEPVQTLIYSIIANPSQGTLSTVSGNQITYTPNTNYSGTDSFTYKANDGTDDSNAATITITVIANPNAPIITSVATDNIINNAEKAAIHVTGTAEANSLVTVILTDGTNTKTNTQQLADGVTIYDIAIDGTTAVPSSLLDGAISVSATATNYIGGVSVTASKNIIQDTTAPTATKLGDGSEDVILEPENIDLIFSELLSASSKTAVQNALTAGADKVLTYLWTGGTLVITASETTTFANDVVVNISDVAGNTTNSLLIVDSSLTATQTTPDDGGNATLSDDTPEVVITDPDQEVTVTVTGSTEATIDVSSFITDGQGDIPQININSDTADIAIPATTVTGPEGWDGIIAAPTVTTIDLPVISGETSTLGTAIEIGFATDKLSFDNAVRILLPGQAGKRAGYSRPGTVFTEITTICSADSQDAGDALGIDGDCKIDATNGLDLVIWTKHFTKFAAYTQTANSTNDSNSSSTLSTASAPVCNDTKPGSAPTLLSAIAGFNSVTLTWSKAVNPVSYYLMTFGTTAGSQTYGNPNVGGADTTSYTVSSLSGGATYYFRVRAGNGCAPGDFSNELFATPTGGFIEGVPAGFEAGVLGETTNSEESEEPTGESTPTGTALGLQTKDDTTNSWWWPWILLSLLPLGWIVYKKWKK